MEMARGLVGSLPGSENAVVGVNPCLLRRGKQWRTQELLIGAMHNIHCSSRIPGCSPPCKTKQQHTSGAGATVHEGQQIVACKDMRLAGVSSLYSCWRM